MDFDFKESFPEQTREASYIFQMRDGAFCEYKFNAVDMLDLMNKGSHLNETMRTVAIASVYDWADSDAIFYHRKKTIK